VLPWPSKSPDLNPIEHLVDDLDRRVRQRKPQPQSLQQLVNALQDEYMRLQDFITITLSCQIPWNVHQRCLSSMRYCSLHHYTPTSESVDFLNTVIGKVLISSFAYPSSSITSGNLTAQRYCDEILQPHVLPLMQQNGTRFQHDNARLHTAGITTGLLTNSNVAVLPWPSKSPDLNPIEKRNA
jgi:transposase